MFPKLAFLGGWIWLDSNGRSPVLSLLGCRVLTGHKYASNVIEKALQCATPEERALLVEACGLGTWWGGGVDGCVMEG